MKNLLLLLGLLFAGIQAFGQEAAKKDSAKIQYQFRSLSGKDITKEIEKPDTKKDIPLAEKSAPEKPAAEHAPEILNNSPSANEITIEDIDREMSRLVSKLPREQREAIRKSNGEMYDYNPAAAFDNGKRKVKTRRIIQIMPASASAVPISAVEAYNEGIEILLYEIYKK